MFKLSFFGGVGTVTGSKFLVETGKVKVLVDCGLFQGLKDLRLRNWQKFPFSPEEIDAVVLTHAHIDHSGSLPVLVREGFKGPIYCSEPTSDLCAILLPDCGRIAEEDARYANTQGFSKHHPALPHYTEKDALKSLKNFSPVPLNQQIKVGDLRINFQPVGHILGTTCVTVANPNYSIQFSGDIGRYSVLLEKQPVAARGGNWVVMESTYGDRNHPNTDPVHALADVVNQVIAKKSVLVIPSFAVGRTQALLYCLHKAISKKLMDKIPIYINSPMATAVTGLYEKYPEWNRIEEKQIGKIFSLTLCMNLAVEICVLLTRLLTKHYS